MNKQDGYDEPKYCRDCACRNLVGKDGRGRCFSSELGETRTDMVTGEEVPASLDCKICRESEAHCGPRARWFEPKQAAGA